MIDVPSGEDGDHESGTDDAVLFDLLPRGGVDVFESDTEIDDDEL